MSQSIDLTEAFAQLLAFKKEFEDADRQCQALYPLHSRLIDEAEVILSGLEQLDLEEYVVQRTKLLRITRQIINISKEINTLAATGNKVRAVIDEYFTNGCQSEFGKTKPVFRVKN